MPTPSAHLLIVDDEADIAALLAYHLARAGYRVRTAATGLEALRALETDVPELVILDLMLPGLSGFDLLREIRGREQWTAIPVILLSARREESDRIEGLRLGADDYVSKPFSPQELVLRVEAILRRVRPAPRPEEGGAGMRVGPFRLDAERMRVEVEGGELELTPTEFRLLQVLMERRGRVQSRQQLLESVWETTARITTRTVDMHVQRLRAKAGTAAEWIETVRGFGYRFRAEAPPSSSSSAIRE